MRVLEYLEKYAAEYEVEIESSGVCVEKVAARKHGVGTEVAKPVIIRADGRYYMCVLPSYCDVDLGAIGEKIGAGEIEFVESGAERSLFPFCDAGAESPLGALYGLPTLMDRALDRNEYIVFQGEKFDKAIFMSVSEYKRLASPRIFSFARTWTESVAGL